MNENNNKRRRSCSQGLLTYSNDVNVMNDVEKIKKRKVRSSDFSLLTIENYQDLNVYDYNISQLKAMSRHYKIRVSGNKMELSTRLYEYMSKSFVVTRIQKAFRRHIVKLWRYHKGNGLVDRRLCTNECDFFSLDPINEVSIEQMISINENGFIYGFDICSLSELYIKTTNCETMLNPFTRNELPPNLNFRMKRVTQLQRCLYMDTIIKSVVDPVLDIYCDTNIHHRLVSIFSDIDQLGNYSDVSWFLSLNLRQHTRYLRELYDIWQYRAQLSNETKRNICHPSGSPFTSHMNHIFHSTNINYVRYHTLEIMNNLISMGVNNDSKSLGAFYVLAALTLVSRSAAAAMPWLYESVCHLSNF